MWTPYGLEKVLGALRLFKPVEIDGLMALAKVSAVTGLEVTAHLNHERYTVTFTPDGNTKVCALSEWFTYAPGANGGEVNGSGPFWAEPAIQRCTCE